MSKTETHSRASSAAPIAQAGGTPGQAAPVTVPKALRARRRSPWAIGMSVALIAAGGVGGAVLLEASGQRTSVVTVVRQVPAGQEITERDLGEASVALAPGLKPVPADERETVVGKRAAVGLVPGSLLSRSQVTEASLVAEGEQVVPVGLKPALWPATELAPGQRVQVVWVPGEGGTGEQQPAEDRRPVTARVVKVGSPSPSSGVAVLDVAVAAEDGPVVLAWSASGNAALALDAGGGDE